jgi:hypothetical protein
MVFQHLLTHDMTLSWPDAGTCRQVEDACALESACNIGLHSAEPFTTSCHLLLQAPVPAVLLLEPPVLFCTRSRRCGDFAYMRLHAGNSQDAVASMLEHGTGCGATI